MNKSDLKLIVVVISISLIGILYLKMTEEVASIANIYYEDNLIKTVSLIKDDNFIVKGANGDVEIEVKNNMIRVVKETSPKHLCSKQGFISKSNETIICLPNKIVIEISGDDEYDTVVK